MEQNKNHIDGARLPCGWWAMLSVVVDAGRAEERLPGLLAALATAAVSGLVREVILAGGGPHDLLAVLREETGAELATDLRAGLAATRSELLLVLPGAIRFRPGWTEALMGALRDGVRKAVLPGAGGAFLAPAPAGVLIPREAALGLVHPDLKALRGRLGRSAQRLG